MPATKDEALAIAVRFNPTIKAAQSDVDAAKHAFRVTDGAFVPNLSLEGRATHADNTYPYLGVTHDDYSGKVVMSWDIFRGGQDVWRRSEMAERHTEATMRHARLQRDALESIDKAWAARTITATRVAALTRQLQASRKTITAFDKEYELGQRSLIDLLNAQNQYFNAAVSLTSSRGVIVFADYQMLAAMGTLLEYLKSPPPVDAAPLDLMPLGLPAYKFPTPRVDVAADRIGAAACFGCRHRRLRRPLGLCRRRAAGRLQRPLAAPGSRSENARSAGVVCPEERPQPKPISRLCRPDGAVIIVVCFGE